jgi:NAD(P)-dependent dehydrogenase (short-subunit alcohol dehydrogenase family)
MSSRVVAVLGVGSAGAAVIRAFARNGDKVVAVDRSESRARQALSDHGAAGTAHGVDLSDPAAVAAWLADVDASHGVLDGVVHLVGGWAGGGAFGSAALTHHQELITPVLTTLQVTSTLVADRLVASSRGFFVMVSSTSVASPTQGNAAYASLKAAAETWTLAMADSFKQTRASATCIRIKALVDSDMRARRPEATFTGYTDADDLANEIVALSDADPATVNGCIVDLTREEYSAP